jgi:hypothetical protein
VADHVSFSPDFHGTTEAYLLCLGLNLVGCTSAVIQQEYESGFVSTLRASGGDSAYVPTTTIYSESDDIVQPQTGFQASAYLLDARNVGVTNIDIQQICPGNDAAGGDIDHQGTIYNALAYAAVVDALTHPGPASLKRIDLTKVCQEEIAPGLTAFDMQAIESKCFFKPLHDSHSNRLHYHTALECPYKSVQGNIGASDPALRLGRTENLVKPYFVKTDECKYLLGRCTIVLPHNCVRPILVSDPAQRE